MRVSPAVVLASLLFAATGWSDQDPSRPGLRLVWVDPTSAATGLRAGVEEEVTSILKDLGVNATGEEESDLAAEDSGRIRVILLDGQEGRPGMPRHVMGCARKDVATAAWVYVGAVARALGFGGPPYRWAPWRQMMTTALGRVVAHEVVHVIAPEVPHAQHGLLRPHLRPADLTGPRPRLDPDSARGFLRGWARRTHSAALALQRP